MAKKSGAGPVALALVAVIASGSSRAWAQLAAPPPAAAPANEDASKGELELVIQSRRAGLDREAVRAAIASELGLTVTLVNEAASQKVGALVVVIDDDRANLVYRSPDGRALERSIDLPKEPERASETIALLAGNLVRNEAAELAASLAAKPPVAAPLATTPPAPAQPPLAAPCKLDGAVVLPVGGDLVPYVGSSLYKGSSTVRRFSINALGGFAAGVHGFEVGGLFNLETSFVCGFQVAGLVNVGAGPVRGFQTAGLVNTSAGARGAQIAGLVNVTAGTTQGFQVGGLVNTTADVEGVQIAGIANVASEVTGAQIGLINVAAKKVKGVQLGLVNYAEDSDASIGLVSLVGHGRAHLDLWGLESGIGILALKLGSRHVHNLYGVGLRVVDKRPTFALGIGGHVELSKDVFVDLDGLAYAILHDSLVVPTMLWQLRPSIGLRVADEIAILAGPTANVSIDEKTPAGADISPYGAWSTGNIRGWPGFSIGLEVF